MKPGQMGYDRGITVFSPDGRLFQVEYAREAVSRGTTTVGVKVEDGVALVVDKDVPTKLVEPKSIEKIYKIDKKIGIATSGLVADSRILVDYARMSAQVNRVSYNERIDVKSLVKKVSDYKQTYTQYGGVRPFGTALLVAGIDEHGTHLYETDPSGANMAYKAVSIGSNRDEVQEVFNQEYEKDMSLDEAIELSLRGLKRASEDTLESRSLDIGTITEEENFRKLDLDEIEEYLSSV